jgi:hypothetical protein
MSAQPAAPEQEAAPDRQAQDADYYRRILHELIDIGTDLARLVHRQAKTQAEATTPDSALSPEPAADVTIAFDRLSRGIRRSISLARRLDEPAPAPAPPPSGLASETRIAARKRILREVEDIIQRKAGQTEAGSLEAELLDRLDSPDLEDDIAQRPVADIIADICRDLGIAGITGTQAWKRRTPEDIKILCARAAQPAPAGPSSASSPRVVHMMPPGNGGGPSETPAKDGTAPPPWPTRLRGT